MTTCWQLALLGKIPTQMIGMTKAAVFTELENGRTIFCKLLKITRRTIGAKDFNLEQNKLQN